MGAKLSIAKKHNRVAVRMEIEPQGDACVSSRARQMVSLFVFLPS
jgi:hypothetical protein